MNAHTNSSRGPTRRNDESDGMVLTHPRREKAGQQEGVLPRSPGAISYVWGQLEDGPELLLTQLSLGRDSLVVRLFPYAHLAQFPDLESAPFVYRMRLTRNGNLSFVGPVAPLSGDSIDGFLDQARHSEGER